MLAHYLHALSLLFAVAARAVIIIILVQHLPPPPLCYVIMGWHTAYPGSMWPLSAAIPLDCHRAFWRLTYASTFHCHHWHPLRNLLSFISFFSSLAVCLYIIIITPFWQQFCISHLHSACSIYFHCHLILKSCSMNFNQFGFLNNSLSLAFCLSLSLVSTYPYGAFYSDPAGRGRRRLPRQVATR